MHPALDAGITFFDVTPYYGLTAAGAVLGKALRGIEVGRYGARSSTSVSAR